VYDLLFDSWQIADTVARFIVEMFNCSFHKGVFAAMIKKAFITPGLKKIGLNATSVNLSVLSILLEHFVACQLMEYLSLADLLPPLQSGFRQGHSTETAVLRVL